MTAWRRVQRTLRKDVEVETLVAFQIPKKILIILLDAKHFKIRKKPFTLYVGFDAIKSKPLAWILLAGNETRDGYDRILHLFQSKMMSIEAVVSDADHSIKASVIDWCALAVHQKCAFHVLKYAFTKLNGRRLIQTEYGKRLWSVIRKIVLEYDDQKKARAYFLKIKKKYPEYPNVWKIIDRNLSGVYQFTKRRDLPIPRTSNQIENFMGRIEQRLKTFRTAKNPTALVKIITAFIKLKSK